MDLKRKLEMAAAAIYSISSHEDEDAAVRLAAMDKLVAAIKVQAEQINEKVKAHIEASL